MAYEPGVHRFTRSDYDALRAEIERLRDLLQAAVNLFEDIAEDDEACRAWLGDCNVALNRSKR
jgi:hypothetical protein